MLKVFSDHLIRGSFCSLLRDSIRDAQLASMLCGIKIYNLYCVGTVLLMEPLTRDATQEPLGSATLEPWMDASRALRDRRPDVNGRVN